jgi:tetratricopeptide (TPR) repeat protein
VALLRRTQKEHPSDFWLNEYLGTLLNDPKLARSGDAVGYYRAALVLRPDSPGVIVNLANALRNQGDLPGAIAAYDKAIALKPDFAAAHHNLGHALRDQGDLPGAIAAFRKAIALQPDGARAYNALGSALAQKGDLAGAIAALQKAIVLAPTLAEAHTNLGLALHAQSNLPGAIAAHQKAIGLKPNLAEPHYNLALALCDQGDLPGAIAAYRKAIGLKSDFAAAHYNLGNALRDQGDLPGAIAAFQKAIVLKPDDAESHCNLGHALQREGELQAALAELRRGHELGSKDPRWGYPSAAWVRQCERLVELDRRLPDILARKATPGTTGERLELAGLCSLKRLNRAATRFYADAFAAQPALANDLGAAHRYNAACAAVLAGVGQGQDAHELDDQGRARLRQQALDWLRADLAACGRVLGNGPEQARALTLRRLQHYLADPDFNGVREPGALARMPERERQAWQELWGDLRDCLAKAQVTPKKGPATK